MSVGNTKKYKLNYKTLDFFIFTQYCKITLIITTLMTYLIYACKIEEKQVFSLGYYHES